MWEVYSEVQVQTNYRLWTMQWRIICTFQLSCHFAANNWSLACSKVYILDMWKIVVSSRYLTYSLNWCIGTGWLCASQQTPYQRWLFSRLRPPAALRLLLKYSILQYLPAGRASQAHHLPFIIKALWMSIFYACIHGFKSEMCLVFALVYIEKEKINLRGAWLLQSVNEKAVGRHCLIAILWQCILQLAEMKFSVGHHKDIYICHEQRVSSLHKCLKPLLTVGLYQKISDLHLIFKEDVNILRTQTEKAMVVSTA